MKKFEILVHLQRFFVCKRCAGIGAYFFYTICSSSCLHWGRLFRRMKNTNLQIIISTKSIDKAFQKLPRHLVWNYLDLKCWAVWMIFHTHSPSTRLAGRRNERLDGTESRKSSNSKNKVHLILLKIDSLPLNRWAVWMIFHSHSPCTRMAGRQNERLGDTESRKNSNRKCAWYVLCFKSDTFSSANIFRDTYIDTHYH